MSDVRAERNLLFGVLAVQMDFISRDALIAAMNAWLLDKSKPLDRILLDQGTLAPDARDLLSAVVAKHLERHAGDPRQSLAALAVPASVRTDLEQIADVDVQHSLVHTSAQSSNDPAWNATTLLQQARGTCGDDRFAIVRPHAAGGLGEVFVALDRQLNREVALKCIREKHLAYGDSRSRFQLEAEITGGLEHPGIVPVYGVGVTADGRPYYAMRLIRGETLKHAIDSFHARTGQSAGSRRLELRQLLNRLIAVCNAVEYAHSRGIVHRDLKPSNIMLGKYGETLVVDWGLVKSLHARSAPSEVGSHVLIPSSTSGSSETLPGSTIGTPAYMSPEQAAGRTDTVGPVSDVYSLGASLYTLLTGQEPFTADDVGSLLQQVEKGEFAPPIARRASVPPELNGICLKAMAHKPEDRYQSCAALAADIEHWLADEPVSAYRDPPTKQIARWGKRHQGVAAASMALAACVFLGLIVGTVILGQKNLEIAAHAAAAVRQGELAEEQRAAASRQLYVSQMNLTQRAWDENNVGRVRELLATQLPGQTGNEDLRGWEWHYLHRLANSERQRVRLEAVCVAISPDGQRSAAGDVAGKVRLWSLDNSDPIDIPAHRDRVNRVLFTPGGTQLLTASRDGSVKVWNLNDLSVTQSIPVLNLPVQQAKSCQMIALSHDGTRLAVGVNDIAIYSFPEGKPLVQIPTQNTFITSLAFTGDGLHLVTGMWDDTVRVWNATSGKLAHAITCNSGRIEAVAVSSDDKFIYAGGRDGSVSIWSLADGRELGRSYFHIGKINDLVLSPDGSRLASASDDATIRVWSTASGALLKTLRGHESGVNGVAFRPDNERLLTSGWDGWIREWDSLSTQEPWHGSIQTSVISIAFGGDGDLLALVGPAELSVIDVRTRQPLWARAATAAPSILTKGFSAIAKYSMSIDAAGARIAVGQPDGGIRLRNARTGDDQGLIPAHPYPVTCVKFSPDGTLLASSGLDRSIAIWNPTDRIEIARMSGHTQPVLCLAFSPDGTVLASAAEESRDADNDMSVRLWDVKTGRQRHILTGHEGGVFTVVFSQDGRRLYSGSRDEMIREWDVVEGTLLRVHRGHSGDVSALSVSQDGRRLASCSNDNTVRLWDLETGQQVYTLSLESRPGAPIVAFSPDGTQLVAGTNQGLLLWDAAPRTRVSSQPVPAPRD